MNTVNGKRIQVIISYTVFVLSGFLIFSPLHKSENLPLSLLCSIIVSTITLVSIQALLSQKRNDKISHGFLGAASAIIGAFTSLFASLMLLTEIIKDVAYIANRGISLHYYTFTALIILLASLYLCTSSVNGVYRFTILSSLVFVILFIVIFFSLLTTRGIVADFTQKKGSGISAILTGIRSGIFFTVDSCAFLICFGEQIKNEKGKLASKELASGFITAYTFIIIYNILTVLIFGQLTSEISDPDYALIKLIRSMDLTEIISAVRIVSFLVKSCIYIHLSALSLKNAFPKIKLSKSSFIALLYLFIPITFLILAIFDKSLKYGAFQHLIYPVTAVMSICFIINYRTSKKKTD